METDIEILKQDIEDKAISANQAYTDMMDAIDWYRKQRSELTELTAQLHELEK